MNEEEVIQLADKISFKLLATRHHEDYEWLVETLKEIADNKQ